MIAIYVGLPTIEAAGILRNYIEVANDLSEHITFLYFDTLMTIHLSSYNVFFKTVQSFKGKRKIKKS